MFTPGTLIRPKELPLKLSLDIHPGGASKTLEPSRTKQKQKIYYFYLDYRNKIEG